MVKGEKNFWMEVRRIQANAIFSKVVQFSDSVGKRELSGWNGPESFQVVLSHKTRPNKQAGGGGFISRVNVLTLRRKPLNAHLKRCYVNQAVRNICYKLEALRDPAANVKVLKTEPDSGSAAGLNLFLTATALPSNFFRDRNYICVKVTSSISLYYEYFFKCQS